ncbi:MAG: class II aldolase/adducin family protein [Acidimicrobiales bacterium]|jgi:ribulose-5-phosphate 4-epimerase/fuculose-1-phosphate aldolase|nr:class II aldolase/adducin family protein [Acidimicrobiales bacterium]
MAHQPTPDRLIPPLSPRQELALLARTLWREGYNDHLAGHITINRGDGTLWCNPWLLHWEELRPEHVVAIDFDGKVVEPSLDGHDWPVPFGIPLHLELHKVRPEVQVAVHSHPLYSTVWADIAEVPPAMDQSSALGGGELVVVDEYEGAANDANAAAAAVKLMGDADMALLAAHGVFVTAGSVRAAHQRCVAVEQRAQRAWHARAISNGPLESRIGSDAVAMFAASKGEGFIGFWEAAVRTELRDDPTLLDHG